MTTSSGILTPSASRPIPDASSATVPQYRPADTRAKAAQIMLGGAGVLAAIQAIAWVNGLSLLDRYTSDAEWWSFFSTVDGIANLTILWNIGTAIAFLAWLHRSVRNVPALGLGTTRWGPWASVVWWFIPVAFLFMPAVAVWDVVKRASRGRHKELLVGWWLAWIGGAVIVRWSGVMPAWTLDEFRASILVGIAGLLVTALAAALAVMLIRRTQQAVDETAERTRSSGSSGATPEAAAVVVPTASTERPSTSLGASQVATDAKVCPDCAEEVRRDARICRYCRFEFDGTSDR